MTELLLSGSAFAVSCVGIGYYANLISRFWPRA